MSDWRRLLAETENLQSDPFNPLNPLLSNEGINLKDKKDEFAGSQGQKASPQPEAPKRSSFSTALPKPCASSAKGPKFSPGQHVLITDNLNRVRAGVVQFADWIDEPLTATGWWYVILDADGLLSETHESRLSDAGLVKKGQ